MAYCPKCAASLRAEKVTKVSHEKGEKGEKNEKEEKDEKSEKQEKSETSRLWALVGGIMLVILGAMSFATIYFDIADPWRGAFFLVIVGAFIIIVALYGAVKASKRNPQP
jgi:cation transport ATPase